MPRRLRRGAERLRGRWKLCTYCEPPEWREIEEFTAHPGGVGGLDNRCNWCRSRLRRERYAANVSHLRATLPSSEVTDANRTQPDKPEWGTPLDVTISHARASMRECERWGKPDRAAEWRAFIAQLETLK